MLRSTVRALASPRRALAILVIALPLQAAQVRLSAEPRAGLLGLAMLLAFVVLGPMSWRALFPAQAGTTTWRAPFGRLVLYATMGAGTVALVGVVAPGLVGIGPTLMTRDAGLLATLALFWVGGYGLGRDIELDGRLRQAHAQVESATRQAEHARLLLLRSQLDPHVLFNTLNAIAEWCRLDGEVAERATLQLAELLRTLLEASRVPSWPLARELALGRALLQLHGIRDPGAIALRLQLDDVPALEVPPMLLLPLCDNAMKHGPGAGHRGEVELGVRRVRDGALVWIENPGRFGGPRDGGEGLASTERRLQLAYGDRARLAVLDAGARTRVELRLPAAGPERGA
ncbi:MAG: histidine kinase [Nannocystaceae bacterium]